MKYKYPAIHYLKYILLILLLLCGIVAVSIFNAKYILPNGLHMVETSSRYVLDNVHLVMAEQKTILKHQQLLINRGIIEKISDAGSPVPTGYKYRDGNNAYVTPGLFDMHVHHFERKALALSLAHGVTSVRMMRGYRMHLLWRQELDNQQWLGSNLYLSSPVLASRETHLLNQPVISPKHGQQLVEDAHEKGFDLIKLYGYLEPAEFEAIVERANELGIAVAKHGPHPAKGADWRFLSGMQSLEHVEDIYQGLLDYQFDQEKLIKAVANIKATGTPVTPTLAVFEHLTKLSNGKQDYIKALNLNYLNPVRMSIEEEYAVARWLADSDQQSAFHLKKADFLKQIVRELHKQDVNLLVGSDSGMMYMAAGISTHKEMALLKQSGLSDFEVIQAATINPARALKVEQLYGSIVAGKIADLVITTEDPSSDIKRLKLPFAVIKNGQWINQQQLNQLKKSAEEHPNFWVTTLLLVEDVIYRYINL